VKRLGSAIVRSARHAPSVPVFERHSSFITAVARLKTRSYELAASTLNRITPTGSVGVPTSSEDDPKRKVLSPYASFWSPRQAALCSRGSAEVARQIQSVISLASLDVMSEQTSRLLKALGLRRAQLLH
jgi:hypothetical protein